VLHVFAYDASQAENADDNQDERCYSFHHMKTIIGSESMVGLTAREQRQSPSASKTSSSLLNKRLLGIMAKNVVLLLNVEIVQVDVLLLDLLEQTVVANQVAAAQQCLLIFNPAVIQLLRVDIA
jgi:hypothetical protein